MLIYLAFQAIQLYNIFKKWIKTMPSLLSVLASKSLHCYFLLMKGIQGFKKKPYHYLFLLF